MYWQAVESEQNEEECAVNAQFNEIREKIKS
jgi:hypothetical protein